MALYVLITPECMNDAQEHQMEDAVDNFKQRILQDQRTTLFDRYPPPYLKKRFRRQERLIAAEKHIAETDDIIVVFLRVFVRSGRDYESFKSNPIGYGDKYFVNQLNDITLKAWLDANREIEKVVEKDLPNEEEQAFLWEILSEESSLKAEEFVYESEQWLKAISDKRLQDRLINLPSEILKCMEDESCEYAIKEFPSDIKVLYRNFKSYNKLFLAGIFLDKPGSALDEIIEANRFVLKNSQVNEEDIIRSSRKSYPGLILLDADMWIDVQKNKEANLALSPEESELLQSVYQFAGNGNGQKGFPLFINGRAGSGKSTILQYLFSDYLGFYLKRQNPSMKPPIYLTYSRDLVEKSRVSVFNVLSKNYKHSLRGSVGLYEEDDLRRITSDCFALFRDHLLRIIQEKGLGNKFRPEKYIDFKTFKTVWKSKYQGDPKALEYYPPDLSWHIIRTYIKGYSTGGYIDEEEYDELPRDEKTVTMETFKLVFEKVWTNWYVKLCNGEDEKGGFWDDQDIVRFIVDEQLVSPEYPAIFCDEAQDFTRIELEFLFRSSIYSNLKITSQDLNRVPFIFAGDPFQTLNPTGFNWENIKTAFVQKFILSLDPKLFYGNPQLHYEELSYNYRSSRNIVKICNSLQALRALYFGHKTLEPQTTWLFEVSSSMPVYFSCEGTDVKEKLKEYLDVLIIVPCAEGDEATFVANDPFLESIIQRDESGVPRNVISPMRSKGLEFERVVVYGFGKYAKNQNFFVKIGQLAHSDSIEDREVLLPYEYYLNQLYVSISRAQKMLIVIDTESGISNFWRFAIDPDCISSAYQLIGVPFDRWEETTGIMKKGNSGDWTGNIEDRPILAERLESEGTDKQDPFMLRQAAMIYKDLQNTIKEKKCKAMAYALENRYNEAGKLFSDCEMFDAAIENYWKASNFKALREIGENYPASATNLKIRAAIQELQVHMSSTISLFKDLLSLLDSGKDRIRIIGDETWNGCTSRIIDNLLKSEKPFPRREWKNLGLLLETLIDEDIYKRSKPLALIYLKADEFERAVSVFESIGDQSSTEYQQTKARIMKERLKGVDSVDISTLSNSEKRIAAGLYQEDERFVESATLFLDLRDEKGLLELAENIFRSEKNQFLQPIITMLMKVFSLNGHFRQIISLLDDNPRVLGKSPNFASYIRANLRYFIIEFVKNISSSESLSKSESLEQIGISDFLRKQFTENKFSDWRLYLHPLVIGAAMERAGKDLDCLKFYGEYEHSGSDNDLVTEVKKRLAAIKVRQASREESLRRNEMAKKHLKEANDKADQVGVDLSDIPRYPDVSEYLNKSIFAEKERDVLPITKKVVTDTFSSENEPLEMKLSGIEVKTAPKAQKLLLTNTIDLSTVTINLGKGLFVSSDTSVIENVDDLEIPAWGVSIRGFRSFKTNGHIVILMRSRGVECKINF